MPWDNEGIKDLEARYASIAMANREALLGNRIVIEQLPSQGELRWGVSTVFRPELPERVWRDLEDLHAALGGHQTCYTPRSVHVTLRSNEGYRDPIADGDADIEGYADAMSAALSGRGPMEVDFRGFIGVRTGVLLCGYPRFDIQDLRRAFFREVEARALVRPGPEPTIEHIRNTCHASMLMFAGELPDPERAVGLLAELAGRDYGRVAIDAFEIVSYVRTLDRVDTVTQARVPVPEIAACPHT